VAGLELTTANFAILPPHFSAKGLTQLNALGIHTFFDCYEDFPDCFKGCCQYLLASVLFHYPILKNWWPEVDHPVWQSKMFIVHSAETLQNLRAEIITGKFTDPDSGMTATGIPNIVRIHARFDEMQASISEFACRLDTFEVNADQRFDNMNSSIQKIPEEFAAYMRQNFDIPGREIGITDLQQLREGIIGEVSEKLSTYIGGLEGRLLMRNLENTATSSETTINGHGTSPPSVHLRYWGGRFNMLPEKFEFPTCTAQHMWSLWYIGITAQQVSPLKNLKEKYRREVPADRRHLIDKASLVVDSVRKVAVQLRLIEATDEIDATNFLKVWNGAFREYLSLLYPAEKLAKESFRPDDVYYTTLHKRQTELINKGPANKATRFSIAFSARFNAAPAVSDIQLNT
jgi:hypothetical protein